MMTTVPKHINQLRLVCITLFQRHVIVIVE